jgi:hypothetical protein
VIAEIEQAFCGFFEAGECDMAFQDHNLDACEAAYQLACDAEENRYKLTLPLSKSVLLCESLVAQDAAAGKKGGEGEVLVVEGSLLTPACLTSGKWVVNGATVAYHQDVMRTNTAVHVFSTSDQDERPLPLASKLSKSRSTPLPAGPALGGASAAIQGAFGGALPPSTAQLLAKDFYEQGLDGLANGLDPSGLFEFKQPDLQRDRDFFKQMILSGEDFADEFGDAPMDFFASEARRGQAEPGGKQQRGARGQQPADESAVEGVPEEDMFEEIKLSGTHCGSRRNQEGLNPNFRGTITYDGLNKRYYVLVLASPQRHVAVVSDLQRYGEHFQPDVEAAGGRATAVADLVPRSCESSGEFQVACLRLLQEHELERFNLPWRWSHWSALFSHAVSHWHLRDPAAEQREPRSVQPQRPARANATEGGSGAPTEQPMTQ